MLTFVYLWNIGKDEDNVKITCELTVGKLLAQSGTEGNMHFNIKDTLPKAYILREDRFCKQESWNMLKHPAWSVFFWQIYIVYKCLWYQ